MTPDEKRKRRRHPVDEKVAILRKHLANKNPVSDICDAHKLQPSVLHELLDRRLEPTLVIDGPRRWDQSPHALLGRRFRRANSAAPRDVVVDGVRARARIRLGPERSRQRHSHAGKPQRRTHTRGDLRRAVTALHRTVIELRYDRRMRRAPILSSIATIAFFLNGCSGTAVHGSVGDNAFGPTFTSTFFKSVTDGDAVAVVIVAITVDDGCAKVLALEQEERAANRAFDESGASTPEAQEDANVILAAELDRIYAEYLPAPWWRLDLGVAFDEDEITDRPVGIGFDDDGSAVFKLRHQREPENYTAKAEGVPEDFNPSDEFDAEDGSIEVLEFDDKVRFRARGTLELIEIDLDDPDEAPDEVTLDVEATFCEAFQDG